jgi:hypothetical protein
MNTHGNVGQVMRPQQHGSVRWAGEYGERLVSVRYRYDPVARLRHTTVELIVETVPWNPPAPAAALIPVAYEEEDLPRQLRARGATWEPTLRCWWVPLSVVRDLHLDKRLDTPHRST